MPDILATAGSEPVATVAAALADVLHARVRPIEIETLDGAAVARRLLRDLRDPTAVACALDASADPNAPCWSVMTHAVKPVLLVPPTAQVARDHFSRVLLPLDGVPESAEAVRGLAGLLGSAGVNVLVLHVFDAASVPMFWDQRTHAHRAWTEEFLSRSGTPPGTRMELRSGIPAEHVRRVAQSEDIDLIALGWSRRTDGGAKTVRESVLCAPVPVLLLPTDDRAVRRRAGSAEDGRLR